MQQKIRVVVNFTQTHLDGIDRLVNQGHYMNRQTLIRDAVRRILWEWGELPFKQETEG